MRICPEVAVLVGECGQGLLGAVGLTEADQGLHQQRPVPVDHQARFGEASGQPVGGLEGGQRVRVPAARQLQQPADRPDRQSHCGFGHGSEGPFGALDPGFCLLRPPLPHQHACDRQARNAGGRVVGPAVPFGQLDRLHAPFGRQGKRPEELDRRLVGQAGELQIRPPDPARQRDALLQVPLGLLEPAHPQLGAAEADQRQRAQLLAQAGLRRLRRLRQGLQPLRLLGHRLRVPALPGVQQPYDAKQNPELPVPAVRH